MSNLTDTHQLLCLCFKAASELVVCEAGFQAINLKLNIIQTIVNLPRGVNHEYLREGEPVNKRQEAVW